MTYQPTNQTSDRRTREAIVTHPKSLKKKKEFSPTCLKKKKVKSVTGLECLGRGEAERKGVSLLLLGVGGGGGEKKKLNKKRTPTLFPERNWSLSK